jgi:hypothetical protein
VRANDRTAAFAAEYSPIPAIPAPSATDVVKTNDPPDRTSGASRRAVK